MSETVLEEYGFKASMMAPGQMQAAERMAAECATLRARVAELEGASARHAEVAHVYLLALSRIATALGLPNDPSVDVETLVERAVALREKLVQVRNDDRVNTDRLVVLAQRAEKAEAALATARAEERERCRAAVEEIGIREAGHGHAVSVGSYARATDEDFEVAKRGCHYCLRVEVLHEAVQAIDALTPTPEPPHA